MIWFAQEKDIPRILEIYTPYILDSTASFEYTVPPLEVFSTRFRAVTEQFPWLVWEENGRILGYAYGSAPFERAAYQWSAEASVYLERSAWGRGIGRELYRTLEKLLKRQGYGVVYAIITSENMVSRKFHERVGYRTVAELPGCAYKFGRELGIVWMEKRLFSGEIPRDPPARWTAIVNFDRNSDNILANLTLS